MMLCMLHHTNFLVMLDCGIRTPLLHRCKYHLVLHICHSKCYILTCSYRLMLLHWESCIYCIQLAGSQKIHQSLDRSDNLNQQIHNRAYTYTTHH
jgi:hypothetical protein